jgi:hypothetical protein
MRRLLIALGFALVVVDLGSGCGAMFNQSSTAMPISVTPPGASISVDGLYVGQAPATVSLSNASSHIIEIQADGYERQMTHLEPRASAGLVVLDCLLLVFFIVPGIIALAVDGATGDWKVLEEDHLSVRLNPAPRPVPPMVVYPPSPPPAPRPPFDTPQAPSAAPPVQTPPPSPHGCDYDTQCKGDRICRDGQCVPPPGP